MTDTMTSCLKGKTKFTESYTQRDLSGHEFKEKEDMICLDLVEVFMIKT